MINKSTKESQLITQISVNTQPNSKATKLSNREEQERKPIKSLLQCEINISQLRPRINDPPVRMKNDEFRTCCKNFRPIQR